MKDKKLYQVGTLAGLRMTPCAWRITQSPDGSYELALTFDGNDTGEYNQIMTRRGEVKNYKSIKTVFNDIDQVEQGRATVIYYLGNKS